MKTKKILLISSAILGIASIYLLIHLYNKKNAVLNALKAGDTKSINPTSLGKSVVAKVNGTASSFSLDANKNLKIIAYDDLKYKAGDTLGEYVMNEKNNPGIYFKKGEKIYATTASNVNIV